MRFSDLPERLREVRGRIDGAVQRGGHQQRVTLVAVTKTQGPEAIEAAWEAGLRDVGENRVQEALKKMDAVRSAVRWHLIGHLQRNKARNVTRFDLVHSIDSARLADAVNEIGCQASHPIDVLLQVNVVGEETKGGFSLETLPAEGERMHALTGLRVRGIMTMAPFDADESTLRRVFTGARDARTMLTGAGHDATELSMGMSNDFEVAVEEGATMVRLGTILFGAREGQAA
ncbi:MAG TPA: YggS family pyridoxal phosphate-dependent enzyme [Gemmatimonadaceae bacterium]|nr:YggS family pyridoxal phosphate-dependent enzyme [Gemmatimonadaceae bacterium]